MQKRNTLSILTTTKSKENSLVILIHALLQAHVDHTKVESSQTDFKSDTDFKWFKIVSRVREPKIAHHARWLHIWVAHGRSRSISLKFVNFKQFWALRSLLVTGSRPNQSNRTWYLSFSSTWTKKYPHSVADLKLRPLAVYRGSFTRKS